jgi:hypothetical protein
MRRAQEYRKNAAETLRLARHAPTSAEKAHLLNLAERWLDLANRIAKRAKRQARDAQHWVTNSASLPIRE